MILDLVQDLVELEVILELINFFLETSKSVINQFLAVFLGNIDSNSTSLIKFGLINDIGCSNLSKFFLHECNSFIKLHDSAPLILHDAIDERLHIPVLSWWQLGREAIQEVTLGLVSFATSLVNDLGEGGNDLLVLGDACNDLLIERNSRKFSADVCHIYSV